MDDAAVERAALGWFSSLGYEIRAGAGIAPGDSPRFIAPRAQHQAGSSPALDRSPGR